MAGLSSVLRPSSLAVVGASERIGSRGAELIDNLRSVQFPGTMYAINPNRAGVGAYPTFPRLSDVPAPIDTVAICVNVADTLAAVHEAAGLGVNAILVLGAGYAETGDAGARVQAEIADTCRDAGIALVGPNCLGPWSRLDRISYWLAPGSSLPFSGIGLVAQSGALASSLMEPMSRRGIALDMVATTGNEADLDIAAFFLHLVNDPRIRVVGLIAESIRRPDDLLAAARLARERGKAVICLLIGASQAGRAAARAHTAALVGDDAVARAFLSEAGVVLVDDLADLTEHLMLFARYPRGLADGVAVTTVSGGGAGWIADLADTAGLRLADLAPETLKTIGTMLQGRRVGNPIDIALAGDLPGMYEGCVDAVAADPNVGTVVIGLNLPHAASPEGSQFYADQVAAAQTARDRERDVVAFSFVPGDPDDALRTAADRNGVPLLIGAGPALRAIGHAVRMHSAPLRQPTQRTNEPPAVSASPIGASGEWDELTLRAAMASYGVPVVHEAAAHNAAEARATAARIGYPVAVKAVLAGVAHKSELGLVRLALADADAVTRAYDQIAAASSWTATGTLPTVAVQEMVASGTELILGCRRDAVFGRALVLGWGGLWVESLAAPQLAPVPTSPHSAWDLIERLFRSALPRARSIVNLTALHDAVLAFSAFVRDLPQTVDVVEINPLMLASGPSAAVVAVDAVIQSGPGEAPVVVHQ